MNLNKKLMRKILLVSTFTFLWFTVAYSDPNNPTNDWLKDKTVNKLTQDYGYKLFSVINENTQTTLYTLTNKKIVVSCVVASGNPNIKFYCFLP